MRNRVGSGFAYTPRAALQGLGQDDDDLDFLDDSDDLTDADLSEPAPDIETAVNDAPTYDADTGQVIESTGLPAVSSGGILSSIASLFGGASNTAQINATGISGDETTSSWLPWVIGIAGVLGVIYLIAED